MFSPHLLLVVPELHRDARGDGHSAEPAIASTTTTRAGMTDITTKNRDRTKTGDSH
jgi:hypothetical protein